jgi:hypothetical protein
VVEFADSLQVVVQVITGPDVTGVSVAFNEGTVVARIPGSVGGTVIAGTVLAGTVGAAEFIRSVQLAVQVHTGATSPRDAALELGRVA